MSRPDGPLLVIGVGNILLRDEGVGVRIVLELERLVSAGSIVLPIDTRLVDGGTLGLDLLPMIADARALVLVDAVDIDRDPGALTVLRDEEIHGALAGHVSPHQVGISDLVAAARLIGVLPDQVALVGVQPDAIEIGLELTGPVEAAVPLAVAMVEAELERLVSSELLALV